MSGETFGQLLRRLRAERGWSQNHLARVAGINAAYVNRMERDGQPWASGEPVLRHTPSRGIALALSSALDLSYAERDRFLFLAGLAPEIDWQARCEDVESALESVKAAVQVLDVVRAAVVDLETCEEPPFIRRRTG